MKTPPTAVIVPWRPEPARERALAYVLDRYAEHHPDWRVTLAECPPGPWVKALAAMPAIEASEADVIVVADADVFSERTGDAVEAVESGAPWSIPHALVHRLSEEGTEAVLHGEPWKSQPLEQRSYNGIVGGGLVVARRETLLEVPMDARFTGWGQEDHSWGLALWTMLGPAWRGNGALIHCWHPPQERLSRKRGSAENWALFHRYRQARGDRGAMALLLQEARCSLSSSNGPVSCGSVASRASGTSTATT